MTRTIVQEDTTIQFMGYETARKNGKSIKSPIVRIGNTKIDGGMTFIFADKEPIVYRETNVVRIGNIFGLLKLFLAFIVFGKPLRY